MQPRQFFSADRAFIFACVFEGALLIVAYFAGWLAGINPLATVSASWLSLIAGVAAVFPMLLLLFWGIHNPNGPIGQATDQASDFVRQFLSGVGLPGFVVLSLLAGVCEEALFRGFLQIYVAEHSSVVVGLLVSSALFGLAHAVSLAYGIIATLIGIYLGLLFLLTGSLLAPIISHAIYDLIALYLLSRDRHVNK